MQKLQLSESANSRTSGRPLHLACSVFQAKSNFPAKRTDFSQTGLDILLVRWDEARGIKRDEIYRYYPKSSNCVRTPSPLSKVITFFAQSKVQQYIADYLTLSTAQTTAQLNSEAVLKSIEAQHGLLVERAGNLLVLHLTFQEYFTARNFVANSDPQVLDKNPSSWSVTTEPGWREVLLLTAEMLGKCCSSVAVNAATQQWADDC